MLYARGLHRWCGMLLCGFVCSRFMWCKMAWRHWPWKAVLWVASSPPLVLCAFSTLVWPVSHSLWGVNKYMYTVWYGTSVADAAISSAPSVAGLNSSWPICGFILSGFAVSSNFFYLTKCLQQTCFSSVVPYVVALQFHDSCNDAMQRNPDLVWSRRPWGVEVEEAGTGWQLVEHKLLLGRQAAWQWSCRGTQATCGGQNGFGGYRL